MFQRIVTSQPSMTRSVIFIPFFQQVTHYKTDISPNEYTVLLSLVSKREQNIKKVRLEYKHTMFKILIMIPNLIRV